MALQDYFQQTENTASTHTWVLVSHDPNKAPIDALAADLADRIVSFQCRGAPQHYDTWKDQAHDGKLASDSAKQALGAFLSPVFGPPGSLDAIPSNHLQGYIGQMLWYFLCEERQEEEFIRRIEPPGFTAIDHGGDGLVIHGAPNVPMLFRLWEIKKFVPTPGASRSSVISTINTAYDQLDTKALEYLARYTATGQVVDDPEMQEFYGKLVELWIAGSDQAAAGVSVATSQAHVQNRSFDAFGQRFPRFTKPVRLRGMLTAIDDFAAFCSKVQEEVWKGL